VFSHVTHRPTDPASWPDQPFRQRYSTAIVSALCFGALSGLGQAAVMLFTDLPSLDLLRMIWTSF
jgi:hypothetical protein